MYNGWAYFGYVDVPLHMAATSEGKMNVGSTAGSELECALPTLLLGVHITISQWPAETSQSVSSLVCRLTK